MMSTESDIETVREACDYADDYYPAVASARAAIDSLAEHIRTVEEENFRHRAEVAKLLNCAGIAAEVLDTLRAERDRYKAVLEEIASHGPECDASCAPDMLSVARAALHPNDTPEEPATP